MNKLTPAAAAGLLRDDQANAVCLYQPTHRASTPPNMTQDQIRFKNLSHQATKLLKDETAARKIGNLLEDLEQNLDFWEHQTDGLAVFATTGGHTAVNLPLETDEYAGSSYFLCPLLGLLSEMAGYYVLVVAQKHPMLLLGDRYELCPSGVELPASIKEALNLDEEFQKSIQFQTAQAGGGPMFHGHGSIKDRTAEDRLNYFRIIDRILLEKGNRELPLLIASADSEAQEYRDISRYPKLLKAHLGGDYPDTPYEELHSLTWPLVEAELVAPRRRQVLADFERLSGQRNGLAAANPELIAEAAAQGRVDRLVLGIIRRTADTVEDSLGTAPKLVFHDSAQIESLERLTRAVKNQGGEILLAEESEMPAGTVCAATFRY